MTELTDYEALNRIAKACFENSVNHGFHDADAQLNRAIELASALPMDPNPIVDVLLHAKMDKLGNRLMLIVGEVAEGHEEGRRGIEPTLIYYDGDKPEGLPIEFADIVIRVFDQCGELGIDIGAAIAEKMAYNATRPHLHGKKF